MREAKRGLKASRIACFALIAMGSALGACGGGGSGDSSTTPTPPDTSTPGNGGNTGSGGTGAASVTLGWEAPTDNSDGSALTDLKGFKIHYGTASQNYTQTVTVDNPGLSRYVLESLAAGTYFIAVTAYNSSGVESLMSQEVTTTLK